MQKIVTDNSCPKGKSDTFGVDQARGQLREAYALIDAEMTSKVWVMGDAFGLADCSAAPAFVYADTVEPIGEEFPNVSGSHCICLAKRSGYARALREAEPISKMFPCRRSRHSLAIR